MPYGAIPESDFKPFNDFLSGQDWATKSARDQQRLELQQQREAARVLREQQAQEWRQRQEERQRAADAERLRHNQDTERRAIEDQEIQRRTERRQLEDQDYKSYQRDVEEMRPTAPTQPPQPTYLPDPMETADTPQEVSSLDKLLGDQLRTSMVPGEGAGPIVTGGTEETPIPPDAIAQVRDRYFQYLQAGVDPGTALQKSRVDVFGASPTLEGPKAPYQPGWWARNAPEILGGGTPADPGHPARLVPAQGVTAPAPLPKPPVNATEENKRRRQEYEERLKQYYEDKKRYDSWKPPPYTGFPYKSIRATAGQESVPTRPQKAEDAGAAPAPRKIKRMTTKGGHVVEYEE